MLSSISPKNIPPYCCPQLGVCMHTHARSHALCTPCGWGRGARRFMETVRDSDGKGWREEVLYWQKEQEKEKYCVCVRARTCIMCVLSPTGLQFIHNKSST